MRVGLIQVLYVNERWTFNVTKEKVSDVLYKHKNIFFFFFFFKLLFTRKTVLTLGAQNWPTAL